MTEATPGGGASPTIRPAARADLLEIYRIERAVFPQPWPYEAFERFLGEPAFLVAEADRRVAGYVVADVTPNFGRDIGHVKDFAVHPDYQGRGVGTALLRRALAVVEGRGAGYVKLEVRESNEPAIRLYRRHGFEYRRTVPRYYGNGESAYVMVRER
ncbi:ribosomal protein S18-alanine N-acetyltransferase [Halomarina pelagica]|uniref:ribosomal protein S18-alanine N-acetyltransferase n=1 Tax=Halomarina pelagica TaxID=2961599 RepID=UPI0020C58079|nr:ribosomal protein S18-alanine N-acetyltransferase [Halomarina sp. BND7]